MRRSNCAIGLATLTSAAMLLAGGAADAEIQNAFVNDSGDLEVEVVDDAPPGRAFDYVSRAQVEARYVCARGGHVQPNREQTINRVLERTERLTADFQGRVYGVLTLNQPIGQTSLRCQGSFSVQLASVRYTQIEVRSELGRTILTRDIPRVFLPGR